MEVCSCIIQEYEYRFERQDYFYIGQLRADLQRILRFRKTPPHEQERRECLRNPRFFQQSRFNSQKPQARHDGRRPRFKVSHVPPREIRAVQGEPRRDPRRLEGAVSLDRECPSRPQNAGNPRGRFRGRRRDCDSREEGRRRRCESVCPLR